MRAALEEKLRWWWYALSVGSSTNERRLNVVYAAVIQQLWMKNEVLFTPRYIETIRCVNDVA